MVADVLEVLFGVLVAQVVRDVVLIAAAGLDRAQVVARDVELEHLGTGRQPVRPGEVDVVTDDGARFASGPESGPALGCPVSRDLATQAGVENDELRGRRPRAVEPG